MNHNRYSFATHRILQYTLDDFFACFHHKIDLLIESEDSVPLSKVDKDFKIDDYIKDHVYPFIDEVIEAKLSFSSSNLVNQIQGWFGKNVSFVKKGEEYLATVRNGEKCLYLWMIHYADVVKVISPDSLRMQVMDYGKRIEGMYKK